MRCYPLPALSGPVALVLGLILLAAHPLQWLTGTWFDPAWDSWGGWIAALTAGLLVWSVSSPVQEPAARHRQNGAALLVLTALIRLLGQGLGINILGAAALAVDVYAIGLLLSLEQRTRPLSPGWLAVLFVFALPVERVLQRGLGFALQQLSATGACAVLTLGAPVQCDGIQLQWQAQTILVDLPCSGTRGLLLLLLLFVVLAALTRPAPGRALAGALIALAAATLGNTLRIVVLATGMVYREALGGVEVLAEPWHSGIGLVTLGLAALPLLLWARTTQAPLPTVAPVPAKADSLRLLAVKPLPSLAFLVACSGIVLLPPQPLDIARPLPAPHLPGRIALFAAQLGDLSAQERDYFTRYGGGAARAAYGAFGLLVVSTTAPLRHLHDPAECLAGAGHTVRYLGQTHDPVPSALYRSTDPQGQNWRITVTYVSERGESATHVAEAVWRWMQAPGTAWRMIQRIAPWELPDHAAQDFDRAVWRALDLPLSPPSSQPLVKL